MNEKSFWKKIKKLIIKIDFIKIEDPLNSTTWSLTRFKEKLTAWESLVETLLLQYQLDTFLNYIDTFKHIYTIELIEEQQTKLMIF